MSASTWFQKALHLNCVLFNSDLEVYLNSSSIRLDIEYHPGTNTFNDSSGTEYLLFDSKTNQEVDYGLLASKLFWGRESKRLNYRILKELQEKYDFVYGGYVVVNYHSTNYDYVELKIKEDDGKTHDLYFSATSKNIYSVDGELVVMNNDGELFTLDLVSNAKIKLSGTGIC